MSLIKTLSANGYSPVKVANIEALELNFREQLEKHNKVTFSDEEFLRIRNHLDGGAVFEKAIKLRDRYELIRDSGTLYVEFTAILAVANIPLLIKYYELLKSKSHNFTIATIFSFGANEDPSEERDESSRDKLEEFMADYNATYGTNFTTKSDNGHRSKRRSNDFNAYYIDIAKKVRDRKIDILIVVNMFLTGFDSPWLNTLYVDKNLKYHGLIQAFSRTNRLKNEKKKHGNIVCYKNLKTEVDKAVLLYSHAASLEEIIENEYNLNIPRYVDTFEEEEPVDLDAVVTELKSIEGDIADVDKRIIDQCKELGIPAPVFRGKV